MTTENHRPLHVLREEMIEPDRIADNRGSYLDFVRRIRRRAAKQSLRGRAGIREDAPHLMGWIGDERTLRVAWDYLSQHGGQTAGIDEWRYCDYPETEIWKSLREERDKIKGGIYDPAEDRIVEISKGPGRGTRRLSIPCIHDRVVQRAVVEVLQPYLDPMFDPLSFGYRPRRGVTHALAHAWHLFRTEGRGVWVTADLRNAFPRVPRKRLLDVVKHYVFAGDVVKFVGRILGEAKKRGLRQGSPLSPLLLNTYLHHHLDKVWRALYPHIPLLRYADDILLMCHTQAEARKAHNDLVRLLRPRGMLVKGDRCTDVVTLTPDRPALWLGFHIEKVGRKNLRFLIKEDSWENLAENLDLAHDAPNAPLHAALAIKGWINDKGPCFKYTDLDAAWDRIAAIARSLAFNEIPSRQEVKDWWQRAYSRWCRLRKDVVHEAAQRKGHA